jgi:hypothetical protein
VSDFVEQSPPTVTTGLHTFNLGRVAFPGTPYTLATSHNSKIWKTEVSGVEYESLLHPQTFGAQFDSAKFYYEYF